eukprot:m.222024 g.222024  ORF g.222024 m.222024 type:complete len:313 (-) comp32280_c0_seq1:49-987(-)
MPASRISTKKKSSGKKKPSSRKKKSSQKRRNHTGTSEPSYNGVALEVDVIDKDNVDPPPPWVAQGPADAHASTCKCKACQLGDTYGEIEIVLVSPPTGGPKVKGASARVTTMSQPGDTTERHYTPHLTPGFTLIVHLTPWYKVADLRTEVAERLYCIPGDVTLYKTQRAADKEESDLALLDVLSDLVPGGPIDTPPHSMIYVVTRGRRFGYSESGCQAYLSTGAPLLHERRRVLLHSERKPVPSAHHAVERTSRTMLGLPPAKPRLADSTVTTRVVSHRVHHHLAPKPTLGGGKKTERDREHHASTIRVQVQ